MALIGIRNRICCGHIWLASATVFLLSACATPPFELGERQLSEFSPVQALHHPDAQGALVMWGGQIVAVHNYATESVMEIVSLPLDGGGRPRLKDEAGVRILVRVAGFLEPVVYASGRYLTALGTVQGEDTVTAGETLLRVPVLLAEDWELWPQDQSEWRPRVNFGLGVGIRL